MIPRLRRFLTIVLCLALVTAGWCQEPVRPPSHKLLPEWTVAMIRLRDTNEFRAKLAQTGFARMLRDEQIRPFAEELYGNATHLAQKLEEQLGMTIEQILAIPQGEVTVAFCAPPALPPVVAAIMDVGDKQEDVRALMEEGVKALANAGFSQEAENYEGFQLDIFSRSSGDVRNVIRFERDNTLVVVSDLNVAKRIVDAWRGANPKTLSANDSFATVLARCQAGESDETQIMWFVDPIGIVRAVTRGNAGAATGLALLPALGLDGLKGIGGTEVMPESEFEGISHLQIHLANPRDGVLEMITLKVGDILPEPWVPAEIMTYFTGHLDIQASYSLLKDLYDSFRGENEFANLVKSQISDRLGVDFEQDVIAELEGRGSLIQWYDRPARTGSQATLVAIKLRDTAQFEKSFDKIMEQFADNLEESRIGGQRVFQVPSPEDAAENGNGNPGEDELDARRRLPFQPTFAVMDEYLIFSDRPAGIERILAAKRDRTKSLAEAKDFQLVAEKLRGLPNSQSSSAMSFSRPAEGLRMLYELLQSEGTREFLSERREDNPLFAALDDAMTKHSLPPFSKLEPYFAPQGLIMLNEESGIHTINLTMRSDGASKD